MNRLMVGIATLGLLALYAPAQGGHIHGCMGEPANYRRRHPSASWWDRTSVTRSRTPTLHVGRTVDPVRSGELH
jgi:hypothetical protein